MTAFFDDLRTQARALPDEGFADAVADLEDQVIKTVNLATGDREFPDDLRERIQGLIALWRIRTPIIENKRAIEYAKALRGSQLLERLHDAFHDVAQRRIRTRFGMLLDSPAHIVKCRDAHDQAPSDPEESPAEDPQDEPPAEDPQDEPPFDFDEACNPENGEPDPDPGDDDWSEP